MELDESRSRLTQVTLVRWVTIKTLSFSYLMSPCWMSATESRLTTHTQNIELEESRSRLTQVTLSSMGRDPDPIVLLDGWVQYTEHGAWWDTIQTLQVTLKFDESRSRLHRSPTGCLLAGWVQWFLTYWLNSEHRSPRLPIVRLHDAWIKEKGDEIQLSHELRLMLFKLSSRSREPDSYRSPIWYLNGVPQPCHEPRLGTQKREAHLSHNHDSYRSPGWYLNNRIVEHYGIVHHDPSSFSWLIPHL